MLRYTESEGAITFAVRVVPRAARSSVEGEYDGALRVRIAAPPADGAANEELVRFLAQSLSVPTRAVEITSGHTSKNKKVRVRGIDRTRLLNMVEQFYV